MRLDLERIALEYVVPCLHDIGFCYLDNFLGEVVGDCVLERVKRMHRDGELADGQLAGPSRGVAKRHLRGDQIKWIGGTEEGCEAINFLLTLIDRLVMYCGSRLGKYYVKERSKVRGCGAPRPHKLSVPVPSKPRRSVPGDRETDRSPLAFPCGSCVAADPGQADPCAPMCRRASPWSGAAAGGTPGASQLRAAGTAGAGSTLAEKAWP